MSEITTTSGNTIPAGKHSNRNANVKQNLFRFVQTRDLKISTDTTDDENYAARHSDASSSAFLGPIQSLTEVEAIKTSLNNSISSFAAHKSYKECNNLNPDLTVFSNWLVKNRKKLDKQKMITAMNGLVALTSAQKLELWDNLVYQTLTNENMVVRDSILRIIQGNHFFEVYTANAAAFEGDDFSKDERKGLAKATAVRVMIPQELFPQESTTVELPSDTKYNKNVQTLLDGDIAKANKAFYEESVKEFARLEEAYLLFNNSYYQSEREIFETALKLAYDNATEIVDPETGFVTYEGLVLPKFVFVPKDLFDEELTNEYLSSNVLELLKNNYVRKVSSYRDILEDLEEKIASQIEIIYNSILDRKKEIYINGSQVSINNFPNIPKVAFKSSSSVIDSSKETLFVSLYTPSKTEKVKTAKIHIGGDGDLIEGELVTRNDDFSTFQFSKEGSSFEDPSEILTGVVITTSGDHYNFGTNSYKKGAEAVVSTRKERDYSNCYSDAITGCIWCKGFGAEYVKTECPNGENATLEKPNTVYGIKKVGIAEFKRVEQELCCYVEGEVSHIENILAREYKERATRSLTRTEITTEESKESEVENLSDTTSTDRHEMQQEVGKVIDESKDRSFGGSLNVNVKYPGDIVSMNTGAYFDGTNSSSSSNSFNQSESFAKEVTERAMERIVKKSSYKRTSRMLREFEDNQKHGFDNRKGSKHVTGIYRWVDKVYKNYLVNYGRRLVYEFSIPEPSKNFKELMEKTESSYLPTMPTPPKSIESAGVQSWASVSRGNYATLASWFNADVENPPEYLKRIGFSMKGDSSSMVANPLLGAFNSSELEIPEGYQCSRVKHKAGYDYYGSDNDASAYLFIGNQRFNIGPANDQEDLNIEPTEGVLPISIRCRDIGAYQVNVDAFCYAKVSFYQNWQQNTFLAIKEAYNQKLQEYKDAKAQYDAEMLARQVEGSKNFNSNPLKNRMIEQQELKKNAINYVLKQLSSTVGIGSNFYGNNQSCGTSPILMSADLNDYAEHIKFLDEAIDWRLMDYTFHPYYWANCEDWKELLATTSSSDMIFEAFLQSGFATMKVPVRGGYEKAFMFFLETGVIWKDAEVLFDDDNRVSLSIDEDLEIPSGDDCCNCAEEASEEDDCSCNDNEDEGCIEAKWTSRVPTSLTIVQDYAAPLGANGLPCFSKDDPKIKFCEDGTPLAAADPDSEDPNHGIMVGNDESYVDSNKLVATLKELMEAGIPLIEALKQIMDDGDDGDDDSPFDCGALDSTYNSEFDKIGVILTDLDNDVIDANAAITALNLIIDVMNDLVAEGENHGCDVTPMSDAVVLIGNHIYAIENPAE